jgi:hypothetical protein
MTRSPKLLELPLKWLPVIAIQLALSTLLLFEQTRGLFLIATHGCPDGWPCFRYFARQFGMGCGNGDQQFRRP